MTPEQARVIEPLLPRLRRAFVRLVEIEGNEDIDWVTLLEMREQADPLSDDSFHRGYLVGVADALGIPIPDIINAIRMRLIKSKRTGQSWNLPSDDVNKGTRT